MEKDSFGEVLEMDIIGIGKMVILVNKAAENMTKLWSSVLWNVALAEGWGWIFRFLSSVQRVAWIHLTAY